MITTAIVVPSAVIFLSAFCMFGENVAMRFAMLDDQLCECDWQLFPPAIQRMLITVLANTQRTSTIIGYGNIECTRERFQIVNGVFIGIVSNSIQFNSITHFSDWSKHLFVLYGPSSDRLGIVFFYFGRLQNHKYAFF